MNKYMAIVRRPNWAKASKFFFEATDSSSAVDAMYNRAGAETSEDIDEYELYQELEPNRYMSVAFKPLTIVTPQSRELSLVKETPSIKYTETAYISYKDAA